jgi:NADPH:quinone reductase-like Zn-dependent oxidoreductase
MKAAALDHFGPPSVLTLHRLPVPVPRPQQVLIAVHAAGVGVWDASIRDGSWRPNGHPRFPVVPGTDGAGVVVAKGGRVRRFRLGDRVCASDFGFYEEYVAVDANEVSRVPPRLDLLHAGAATTTGLTALQGIDNALRVRRAETVLIFGASGAVGTLAVQFAKRLGAKVLATASGRDATALVRRLGADAVIDIRKHDAVATLRKLAPDGIDAALALAGGDKLERSLDCVRAGGRIAYPNGVEPEPRRRPGIRVLAYDGEPGPRQFARLARAVAQAKLRVPIAAIYSLADAAKAHARLARGHILGRIVLQIHPGNR